jgi:hypothetical protein
MKNRTWWYLTGVVIVSVIVLFSFNSRVLVTGELLNEKYLKYNEVQGIAVEHQHMKYTLNFAQQKEFIAILNRALPVRNLQMLQLKPLPFESIVVYQFNQQPLIFLPLGFIDDRLVFSVPNWNSEDYLMEISNGRLQEIFSQIYDETPATH